jgi:uracil-DNA glycosylase family 4
MKRCGLYDLAQIFALRLFAPLRLCVNLSSRQDAKSRKDQSLSTTQNYASTSGIASLTAEALCWRIFRVSKEIRESLAEIILQLREQLQFYGDLGLADIGGSSSAEPAPVASFTSTPAPVLAAVSSPSPPPVASPLPRNPLPETAVREKTATPQNPAQEEKPSLLPKKGEGISQTGLFGDLAFEPGTASSRNALPVLSALPVDATLEAIRADIGDCRRCKLHEQRTKIVFGEGNPQAKLMFVGEGPGADEDLTGRPFVGRAGQLLDKIIAAIGLKREDVYIGNVVKCRPPQNRTPERDEVDTCEPFLFRQIALINPKVIVALGSPAFQCLFRTREPISRARGAFRDWNGIKVMPTFHPAYLLRSPDKKREAWEDMKIVRDYLNSISG